MYKEEKDDEADDVRKYKEEKDDEADDVRKWISAFECERNVVWRQSLQI